MALSPSAKKLILLGGVALSLHLGFLAIKPIIIPEQKQIPNSPVDKLRNI